MEAPQSPVRIRMDKTMAARVAIFMLPLLWPLIVFGRPSYIPDSVSYLKGGQVAVEFAMSKIMPNAPPVQISKRSPSPAATNDPAPTHDGPPKAARSPIYSIAAYLLRWPGLDMTGLALAQIAAAAFVCAATAGAIGLVKHGHFAALAIVLAFATPLAAYCANTEPDIFAALLTASLILFVTMLDRLSNGVRLSLATICTFAITAHASIPPLAVGLILVGGCWLVIRARAGSRIPRSTLAWMTGPILLGMVVTAATNFVAFGDGGIAAKRFPLALARSVSDGPGRWYLQDHCRTREYAVCEVFGTKIPSTVNGFVFDKTGLNGLATPEQMDRIRAEESEIVWRAALTYPGSEIATLSGNIFRQLFDFGLAEAQFSRRVTLDSSQTPILEGTGQNHQLVLGIVEWLSGIVAAATLIIGVWRFLRFDTQLRAALILLLIAFLGNAVIVVVFSGVAERYEARMIWLVPLFVLSMVLSRSAKTTGYRAATAI